MKSDLNITALQVPLVWEEVAINRNFIDAQLQGLTSQSDVILLPEMFTSGFTMKPKAVSETMQGETIQWMKEWAKKLDSALGGSLVIEENEKFYNRFIFITPEGSFLITTKDIRLLWRGNTWFIIQVPTMAS